MPDSVTAADARRADRALVFVGSLTTTPAELQARAGAPSTPSSAPPVLLFDRVSKWYGPVIGINQVTLELRAGITGLVGHNGSGKTTLLRLAAGLVKPDIGRVAIAGHDAWSTQAKMHVGYCPEQDRFYEELSGRAFLRDMARLCGYTAAEARRRTEAALEQVGMHDRADRPLAGYSKGMRQRIKLAQALLHDPPLLLLDEPLSGIDPIGRRESVALFQKLAERGKCLLVSSHELDELEKLTEHVAIMAAGRIAAVGPLPQIRDLLDQHPLTVRITCEQNRELASALLKHDCVVGLDRDGADLLVRTRAAQQFFRKVSDLVIEENFEIQRLETLDESTEDVLTYLLGGKR